MAYVPNQADSGRTPGQQQPGRYPFTGPAYAYYGEQPGWIYNPWTDTYKPDPKAQQQYLESQGLGEPEPPSLLESLLPVAGTAGAIFGAKELASGLFEDGISGVGSNLGLTGEGGLLSQAQSLFNLGGAPDAAVNAVAADAGLPGIASAMGGGSEALGVQTLADGSTLMSDGSIVGAPGIGLTPILGAAGALAGGYGLYDAIQSGDEMQGALSGAGLAAGLGMAAPLVGLTGPVGWGLAGLAALGGLGGFGLTSLFGDKQRWKEERDRLYSLRDNGVYIPDNLISELDKLHGGRSKEELIAIEEEKVARGEYGNPDFARTRDEKFLKGQDIVNYSVFAEHDPEWFTRPLDERIAYAQSLLDAGLVREARGQMSVDWGKAPPPPWEQAQEAPQQTQQPAEQQRLGLVQAPQQSGQQPRIAAAATTQAQPQAGLISFNQSAPQASNVAPQPMPRQPVTSPNQTSIVPFPNHVGGPQGGAIQAQSGGGVATNLMYRPQTPEQQQQLNGLINLQGVNKSNVVPQVADPRNKLNLMAPLMKPENGEVAPPQVVVIDNRNKYNPVNPLMGLAQLTPVGR